MALVIVAEDLVGLADLLELDLGLGALLLGDLVGVVLQGGLAHIECQFDGGICALVGVGTNLAICLLDFFAGSALIDREELCRRTMLDKGICR
jgi:hypothetical protein